MQSGSAISPWALGRQHREAAQHAGETLGCSDTSGSDVLLRCLQAADAKQLVELSQDFFVSPCMVPWSFDFFLLYVPLFITDKLLQGERGLIRF